MCTNETGHARRVTHETDGFGCRIHLDEHVAGEHATLLLDLLAVSCLDRMLGRYDDAAQAFATLLGAAALLQVAADFVLVT